MRATPNSRSEPRRTAIPSPTSAPPTPREATPNSWSDLPDEIRLVFDQIWHDGQTAFLAESTKSSAVAVNDSDHDLPAMRPDAVVDALLEVLDQAGS